MTVKLNLTGTNFDPIFGRPVGDSYMTHPDSALALARAPVVLGGYKLDVRGSDFGSLAARHNLLEEAAPRQARLLERLIEATRDPKVKERLRRGDGELRRALEDPRVKALLERGAAGAGEAGELSEEELQALVERLKAE